MMNGLYRPLAGLAAIFLLASTASVQTGCGDDTTTSTTGGGGVGGTGAGGTGAGGTGAGGSTGGGGTGGEGAMGGGGDGGAPPLTGEDTCPGDPYDLSPGTTLNLFGDTSMAADDYQSFCGDPNPGNNGDLVYALTFDSPGTLSLNHTSEGALNPALYVRTTCDDDDTTVFCRDISDTQRTFKQHVEAQTYYVIADASGEMNGAYTLTVDYQAPICGDGVTNPPNEECDDGNNSPGDGCVDCNLEGNVFNSCANPEPEMVTVGDTLLIGTTLGNSDDHTFSVGCPGPTDTGGGPDRVYEIEPDTSGTMTIKLGFEADGVTPSCVADPNGAYCWDHVLHVRHADGMQGQATCSDISNEVACDATVTAPAYTHTVTFPVTANEKYYVFIDSYWNGGGTPAFASGPYFLHVNLQ